MVSRITTPAEGKANGVQIEAMELDTEVVCGVDLSKSAIAVRRRPAAARDYGFTSSIIDC